MPVSLMYRDVVLNIWLMPIHVLLYRGQAIQIRQEEDDAVAGLFSQIGELYVVHHIWGKY